MMMMTNNTSTSTFIKKIIVANLMVAALLATYMRSNDSSFGLKGSRKLQTTNLFFTIGPGKPTNATSAPVTSTPFTINFPSFFFKPPPQPTTNLVFAIGPGNATIAPPRPFTFNPFPTNPTNTFTAFPFFQPGPFTINFPNFNSQNTGFAQFPFQLGT
jgi:hypothetical protein